MCNCKTPKPIVSQLYQDSYYLKTNKNLAKAPIGKVVLILHNISDLGRTKAKTMRDAIALYRATNKRTGNSQDD